VREERRGNGRRRGGEGKEKGMKGTIEIRFKLAD